jgi:hypothetical protein
LCPEAVRRRARRGYVDLRPRRVVSVLCVCIVPRRGLFHARGLSAALDSTRGSPTASKAMVKLAAVLSIFLGLVFGLPCAYGIRYLSTTGKVWTFLGFPTYGGGPFEGIGIRTTVPLLVAFLVVCGLEVVTGWLLWRGMRAGAVLAVALLPFEVAFWIGFALPLGPPLGLARAILLIMKWSSFTRPSN